MDKDKKVYTKEGELFNFSDITMNTVFHEHCDFKDAPCHNFGWGWYDRCAWCKDNNGFIRKSESKEKPF